MAQPHPHAAEGFFGKGEDIQTAAEPVHTTTIHPKGLHVSTSSEHERTGASLHVVGTGNEVLENDAQSKGRWFQYLKTKQFWLTMLLGQGTFTPTCNTLS
jgi:solute carrier family 35 protein F1/2